MEDQTVGGGMVGKWVVRGLKWGMLVVLLGLLDASMGGNPKIVEVLGGLVRGVKRRLT
jgi:hypothetical protein